MFGEDLTKYEGMSGIELENEALKAERAKDLYLTADLYRLAIRAYGSEWPLGDYSGCKSALEHLDD